MKIRILDLIASLYKNPLHRDWLYGVPQVFRANTGVTEHASDLHEQLREEDAIGCYSGELIEMATIMSLFSENSMACFTDRNGQIRLLWGSA